MDAERHRRTVTGDSTPASAADIPSVDRLLNDSAFAPLLAKYARTQVTAALRGVSITLVLPGVNNLPFVQWASRSYLWELQQHGVRIFSQPPPFVHTKFMVVDGSWSLIGSANLDPRSLRLNFELDLEVYDLQFARLLEGRCALAVAASRELTLAEMDGRTLAVKLRDGDITLYTRGDSANWYAAFRLPDGGRLQQSLKTQGKAEAKERAIARYDEIKWRSRLGLSQDTVTFSQAAEAWLKELMAEVAAGQRKVRTVLDYSPVIERYLDPFFGAKPVISNVGTLFQSCFRTSS